MDKQELIDLINKSRLGFSVKDSTSALNEVQEKAVQQAVTIHRAAQGATAIDARSQSTAARVSSGVRIRRRPSEESKVEEQAAVSANEPVGLKAIREKKAAEEAAKLKEASKSTKVEEVKKEAVAVVASESDVKPDEAAPSKEALQESAALADTKVAETKVAETKAAETKAAETKAADTKAAETKAAETKAAELAEEAEAQKAPKADEQKKTKDGKTEKSKAKDKEQLVIEIQPKFDKDEVIQISADAADTIVDEPLLADIDDEPEAELIKPVKTSTKVSAKKKGTRLDADSGSSITGFIDPAIIMARLDKDNKRFSGEGGRGRASKSSVGRTIVSSKDLYPGSSKGGYAGHGFNTRSKQRAQRQAPAQKPVITVAAEHKRVVRISEVISVSDLAKELGVKAAEVIQFLMKNLGMMVTLNQTIDFDTAELVAAEYDHTVQNIAFKEEDFIESSEDAPEDLVLRAPVVTVMGHVDHGKTSLLDAIRNSRVTSSEAGGITQHIGASTIDTENGKVVFLDTPGHEAFTALRARGAKVTDLVVLVVAADDGVMPQTVEAINHAKAAEAPIIVAINKIDKPSANPDRVKQALTEYNLIPEEWGGTTLFKEVSALTGAGIDELLELIQLQSEVLELKANPDKEARGIILEAYKDKSRGTVATMIVQEGTLHAGDLLVSGASYGKIKTMQNDKGKNIRVAGPSTPVKITGLSDVPDAGEPFFVTKDEKVAKEFTMQIKDRKRNAELKSRKFDPWAAFKENKQLNVIIKADVQGSLEALEQSLQQLSTSEVELIVVHSAVGGATESDVQLAIASNAFIIGFNTRPEARAADVAKREGITLESFSVIYDVIDRVTEMMSGLLDPVYNDNTIGHVEIRETFSVPKVGTIAGAYVLDGKIIRNAKCRLLRQGKIIYESKIASLKRFKDDAKEVRSGFECGFSIENYNDIKVGDTVEIYEVIETKATL
jgi:translation initiation factor IF-2